MSSEYTGEFDSPLDSASLSAVLQEIAALDYLEVVREDKFQLGVRFRGRLPNSWGEDFSLELGEQSVILAFHRGKSEMEARFVRDLLVLLSDHEADCTLVEWQAYGLTTAAARRAIRR